LDNKKAGNLAVPGPVIWVTVSPVPPVSLFGALPTVITSDALVVASVTDAKGTYDQASAGYRNVSAATVPDVDPIFRSPSKAMPAMSCS